MKITEKELRKIILEEIEEVRRAFTEGDVASQEEVSKVAGALGSYLVGQPNVAADIRDALADRFPDAAKALFNSFTEAQAHLDMVYSSYDE
tara:strand:+ start:30 stop:302 length:273 start_codon:yes stop_codon:yes gene_type:complete